MKIKLVRNDTRPYIVVSLTDENANNAPVDLTGATVKMYFRVVAATTIKDTLTGQLLVGKVEDDGSITTTSPYDVLGAGGRVQFPFNPTTLDTAGEFEGEIECTFADGGRDTVFDIVKFTVRADFG